MKKYLVVSVLISAVFLGGCWRKATTTNTPPVNEPIANTNTNTPDDFDQPPIRIEKPRANEMVSNPLIIKGEAPGTWYFEGSFPISVVDNAGNLLAIAPAQAQGEWMTTEMVPFEVELILKSTNESGGYIIFQKDNPSAIPEYGATFELPILFNTQTMSVKVFFGSTAEDPDTMKCDVAYATTRQVPKTVATGRAALLQLLAGPTDAERAQGFFTSINERVKLLSLDIKDGTATANFDSALTLFVAGSCRVSIIRAQIAQTLMQFPTVKNVVIQVNGKSEDVLQP